MHSKAIRCRLSLSACCFAAVISFVPPASATDTDTLIKTVQAVDQFGKGNAPASKAARELSAGDTDVLLDILAALGDANPLAENWLRGAFEAVADRTLRSGGALPTDKLEAFVLDRQQYHRARRLAYEWLVKADPAMEDRLVPGMIDDPSPELRREAVARLIDEAKQLEGPPAIEVYRKALAGAVDGDQVRTIAVALSDAGENVDLVKQFGLMTEWYVIGPFNNRDKVGFDTVYPPENEIDLKATYDGQLGEVSWERLTGKSPQGVYNPVEVGVFDLAALTEPYKGACSYATTTVHSDRARPVEFRVATPNAWKLWVNGELLLGHEEYHRGMLFDQYPIRGRLRAGENVILLKICQNEQTEDWAQDWQFQFRICDTAGQPLHLAAEGRNVSQR